MRTDTSKHKKEPTHTLPLSPPRSDLEQTVAFISRDNASLRFPGRSVHTHVYNQHTTQRASFRCRSEGTQAAHQLIILEPIRPQACEHVNTTYGTRGRASERDRQTKSH